MTKAEEIAGGLEKHEREALIAIHADPVNTPNIVPTRLYLRGLVESYHDDFGASYGPALIVSFELTDLGREVASILGREG